MMNIKDNDAKAKAVDSLLNFETVSAALILVSVTMSLCKSRSIEWVDGLP